MSPMVMYLPVVLRNAVSTFIFSEPVNSSGTPT